MGYYLKYESNKNNNILAVDSHVILRSPKDPNSNSQPTFLST